MKSRQLAFRGTLEALDSISWEGGAREGLRGRRSLRERRGRWEGLEEGGGGVIGKWEGLERGGGRI